MRRRDFVRLIGGGAAAWPFAARAQQAAKLPTIGLLGVDARSWAAWATAFAEQLKQFGWIEGRSVTIEYRWSEEARRLPKSSPNSCDRRSISW